ncbi:2-hydroxyacid dehydrogenase [Marinimicrococcus flavescens]|uniref:Glyoxylate/hydroxypyruvate reductase A n=1 Tax=Marinimicrococcus flavescens TaxID=3031815 RepID=A0AAP3UXJ3_9PROT|nr:glyoxylate/hydroxypyruvate reductase A [Marinimicrococcus flavescens]
MKVVLHTAWANVDRWIAELREQAPDIELRLSSDIGDPAEIDAALVWQPPAGFFEGMTRLRLVQVLGAGIDALVRSGVALPENVPLARLVDPLMSQRMAEYALHGVMRFHRRFDLYERQQQAALWERHFHDDPAEIGVGIMGVGEIGMTTAELLRKVGYDVFGWSRSPRPAAPVKVYAGREELPEFLARCRILVCILPLTGETRGIIDRETLALMPKGSFVINVARGPHVVVDDLLAALDSGRLEGAMLDVFDEEPLPSASPLWSHPKVLVTPHAGAITNPRTAMAIIVEQLRRIERGETPANLVDLERGY